MGLAYSIPISLYFNLTLYIFNQNSFQLYDISQNNNFLLYFLIPIIFDICTSMKYSKTIFEYNTFFTESILLLVTFFSFFLLFMIEDEIETSFGSILFHSISWVYAIAKASWENNIICFVFQLPKNCISSFKKAKTISCIILHCLALFISILKDFILIYIGILFSLHILTIILIIYLKKYNKIIIDQTSFKLYIIQNNLNNSTNLSNSDNFTTIDLSTYNNRNNCNNIIELPSNDAQNDNIIKKRYFLYYNNILFSIIICSWLFLFHIFKNHKLDFHFININFETQIILFMFCFTQLLSLNVNNIFKKYIKFSITKIIILIYIISFIFLILIFLVNIYQYKIVENILLNKIICFNILLFVSFLVLQINISITEKLAFVTKKDYIYLNVIIKMGILLGFGSWFLITNFSIL